jgi:hypothetical protein
MRATTLLAGVTAVNAVAFASPGLPHLTGLGRRAAEPTVSISYSTVATLLVTNGNRVPTTISVPIPITLGGGSSSSSSSGSDRGGGGSSTTSDFRNSTSTLSGGQNNTAIQSTQTTTTSTPTTLPYAASTIPYGGGGTTVGAPVPGGSGNLPQGPGDGYHNAAAHVKVVGTIIGLCIGVGSVAAVQLAWSL